MKPLITVYFDAVERLAGFSRRSLKKGMVLPNGLPEESGHSSTR